MRGGWILVLAITLVLAGCAQDDILAPAPPVPPAGSGPTGQATITQAMLDADGFYAPPWDVWNGNEDVLKIEERTDGPYVVIDHSSNSVKLTYEDVWVHDGTSWKKMVLSGTNSQYQGFLRGDLEGKIPAQIYSDQQNLVLAYVCTDTQIRSDGRTVYACGCSSTNLASCDKWNAEIFTPSSGPNPPPPPPGTCNDDGDCTAPQTCNIATGQCVDPAPTCNPACSGSQVCDTTTLTCIDPLVCNPACTGSQTCNTQTGTCEDPTSCSPACTGSQVCDTTVNQCVDGPECTTNAGCAAPLVCDQSTQQCIDPNGGCTTSDDCFNGEICDTTTNMCVEDSVNAVFAVGSKVINLVYGGPPMRSSPQYTSANQVSPPYEEEVLLVSGDLRGLLGTIVNGPVDVPTANPPRRFWEVRWEFLRSNVTAWTEEYAMAGYSGTCSYLTEWVMDSAPIKDYSTEQYSPVRLNDGRTIDLKTNGVPAPFHDTSFTTIEGGYSPRTNAYTGKIRLYNDVYTSGDWEEAFDDVEIVVTAPDGSQTVHSCNTPEHAQRVRDYMTWYRANSDISGLPACPAEQIQQNYAMNNNQYDFWYNMAFWNGQAGGAPAYLSDMWNAEKSVQGIDATQQTRATTQAQYWDAIKAHGASTFATFQSSLPTWDTNNPHPKDIDPLYLPDDSWVDNGAIPLMNQDGSFSGLYLSGDGITVLDKSLDNNCNYDCVAGFFPRIGANGDVTFAQISSGKLRTIAQEAQRLGLISSTDLRTFSRGYTIPDAGALDDEIEPMRYGTGPRPFEVVFSAGNDACGQPKQFVQPTTEWDNPNNWLWERCEYNLPYVQGQNYTFHIRGDFRDDYIDDAGNFFRNVRKDETWKYPGNKDLVIEMPLCPQEHISDGTTGTRIQTCKSFAQRDYFCKQERMQNAIVSTCPDTVCSAYEQAYDTCPADCGTSPQAGVQQIDWNSLTSEEATDRYLRLIGFNWRKTSETEDSVTMTVDYSKLFTPEPPAGKVTLEMSYIPHLEDNSGLFASYAFRTGDTNYGVPSITNFRDGLFSYDKTFDGVDIPWTAGGYRVDRVSAAKYLDFRNKVTGQGLQTSGFLPNGGSAYSGVTGVVSISNTLNAGRMVAYTGQTFELQTRLAPLSLTHLDRVDSVTVNFDDGNGPQTFSKSSDVTDPWDITHRYTTPGSYDITYTYNIHRYDTPNTPRTESGAFTLPVIPSSGAALTMKCTKYTQIQSPALGHRIDYEFNPHPNLQGLPLKIGEYRGVAGGGVTGSTRAIYGGTNIVSNPITIEYFDGYRWQTVVDRPGNDAGGLPECS